MKAKIILKILNPFIWFINFFNYLGHLENNRFSTCSECGHKRNEYIPYDFSKDLKYF